MKTRLIPILTLAAATGSAFTAFADLEQRDSSQFTHKYEMLKLPTAENEDGSSAYDFTCDKGDWITVGTGSDLGTILMDMSTGNKKLESSAAVGSNGDLWKTMAATHETGYTIETRLKILESTGTSGALYLNGSLPDGKYNGFLYFYPNQLKWGSTTIVPSIDTAEWHTYRVVRLQNEDRYHVYVDGELVNGNLLNAYNGTLNRLIFGAGGADYKSKVRVSYLRLARGAYAPLTPNDKSRRKASTDFPVQYEMRTDDTRISATGNASDWTIGGSGATIEQSSGVLSVAMSSRVQAYWQTTDNVWKSVVTPQTPFTVEFKVKINGALVNDRAMIFMTGTSKPVGSLFVGANSVSWQVDSSMGHNIVLDTNNNTDAFHVFRITYDGGSRHGFTVWRDGIKIGEYLVDCTNFYNFSNNALGIVRFGVASSGNNATHSGSFDIDYIRWDTTGAYDWKDSGKGLKVVLK